MPQPESARLVRCRQEATAGQNLQRVAHLRQLHRAARRQHRLIQRPARHRQTRHHLAGRARDLGNPRQQQIPQLGGKRRVPGTRRPPRIRVQERHQLFGEQRVALGAGEHLPDLVGTQRLPQHPEDLGGRLLQIQRCQLLEPHPRLAPHPPEPRIDRRRGRLTGAASHDQPDGRSSAGRQNILKQVQRRWVGPMHVLDHHGQATLPRDIDEDLPDSVKQLTAIPAVTSPGLRRRYRSFDQAGRDPLDLVTNSRRVTSQQVTHQDPVVQIAKRP